MLKGGNQIIGYRTKLRNYSSEVAAGGGMGRGKRDREEVGIVDSGDSD